MENISKLLFATTLLTIFAYLLAYVSSGLAGNGGEYWGFDGQTYPYVEANDSFDAGEYILLELDILDPLGKRIRITPNPISCASVVGTTSTATRRYKSEKNHSTQSVQSLQAYLSHFNRTMSGLMLDDFGHACTVEPAR